MLRFFTLVTLTFMLAACNYSDNFAPVSEINAAEALPPSGQYQVKDGETLYSIAWRYGLDFRYLAKRNHIDATYAIRTGQVIYLTEANKKNALESSTIVETKPILANATPPVYVPEPNQPVKKWRWPVKGPIIAPFSRLNKGIGLAGRQGEPIYSTAAGKVVYCGNGLRGYGNLIIIKHNNLYLSAYAHNQLLLVKEGEWVQQGQKIAEMGHTGTDRNMLHFEIRRAGKPVNPISLLN